MRARKQSAKRRPAVRRWRPTIRVATNVYLNEKVHQMSLSLLPTRDELQSARQIVRAQIPPTPTIR